MANLMKIAVDSIIEHLTVEKCARDILLHRYNVYYVKKGDEYVGCSNPCTNSVSWQISQWRLSHKLNHQEDVSHRHFQGRKWQMQNFDLQNYLWYGFMPI